jgi:protein TonB
VPCTDPHAPAPPGRARSHAGGLASALVAVALLVGGCAQPGSVGPGAATAPASGLPSVPRVVLPPEPAARDWDEFRLRAARRLVAANPHLTYEGPVPDPLLAIPVLEIELSRDGHVRAIEVLRVPSQAEDTIELARQAVLRAAPFGDVSRLPRPWTFVEVFLFDDERRFKPRTLEVD